MNKLCKFLLIGLPLIVTVVAIIANIPEMKRYAKIEAM